MVQDFICGIMPLVIMDIKKNVYLCAYVALSLITSNACAPLVDNQQLYRDSSAVDRMIEYRRLKNDYRNGDVTLTHVNAFWQTRIRYLEDIENQGVADYWQTTYETLLSGVGDCEDAAIGRFFTISKVVSARLAYSKVSSRYAHMSCIVLNSTVILDRYRVLHGDPRIKFSFDEIDLFVGRRKVGDKSALDIDRWNNLQSREHADSQKIDTFIQNNRIPK